MQNRYFKLLYLAAPEPAVLTECAFCTQCGCMSLESVVDIIIIMIIIIIVVVVVVVVVVVAAAAAVVVVIIMSQECVKEMMCHGVHAASV